jgi:predicted small metal-binding protein
VITAETEEDLASEVIEHARAEHNHELSREHIVAEIRGEDPEEVHKRIGM